MIWRWKDEKIPYFENPISKNVIDKVLCRDSRKMNNLLDSSVHLVVTSSPYNVSKEYDQDLTMDEYGELLKDVFLEAHRVLVNGGIACINIANVRRKSIFPIIVL